MDRASILDTLERSEWFLVQSEALCERLRRMIETRQRDGLDTSAALELLTLMEETLARRIDDRIKLLQELTRAT